jgi:hypothetical protein
MGSPSLYFPYKKLPFELNLLACLRAHNPVNYAGILILPAKSVPIPKGEQKDATTPLSPPELPPHDLFLSQGFRQYPNILLFV